MQEQSSDAAGPRIAIVGWGSLIWDLDDLAPKIRGGWRLGAGPALPLEFSRISRKRGGALTAVIDPNVGEASPTAVIESVRSSVSEAADDLAERERAPLGSIGWCDVAADESESRLSAVSAIVMIWCRSAGWDGAVWTDLSANFATVKKQSFDVEAALAYLQTLDRAALDHAIRYIESAPLETDTPFRRALAADPWWLAEAEGLARRGGFA